MHKGLGGKLRHWLETQSIKTPNLGACSVPANVWIHLSSHISASRQREWTMQLDTVEKQLVKTHHKLGAKVLWFMGQFELTHPKAALVLATWTCTSCV